MFRLDLKPVLLFCGIALNLAALSVAQDTPAMDTSFDPSIHDVSLVPPLQGPATVANGGNPNSQVSEQSQHYASQRPTIIVRSGEGNSSCLNECELAVEPINSSIDDRFRLKLSIPESVEVVEVFSQRPGKQAGHVRVLLEPAAGATELIPALQEKCGGEQECLQLVSAETVNAKFQANPFFGSDLSRARKISGSATFENNDFVPSPFHLSSAKVNELSQEVAEEPRVSNQLPLRVNLIGPRSLEAGASAEFEINLLNPSSADYRNVMIQLQIPDGLEPLLLDRNAWLDAARRTVSWKVDELKSGQLETIHYAVLTTTDGPQLQKISVGVDGFNQDDAEIQTLVTNPFDSPKKLEPVDNLLFESHE